MPQQNSHAAETEASGPDPRATGRSPGPKPQRQAPPAAEGAGIRGSDLAGGLPAPQQQPGDAPKHSRHLSVLQNLCPTCAGPTQPACALPAAPPPAFTLLQPRPHPPTRRAATCPRAFARAVSLALKCPPPPVSAQTPPWRPPPRPPGSVVAPRPPLLCCPTPAVGPAGRPACSPTACHSVPGRVMASSRFSWTCAA